MSEDLQQAVATPNEAVPRRSRLKRWAPWLLYVAAIGLLGYLLLTALLSMAPEAVLQLRAWVRKASYVGAMVQALICIGIIGAWPQITAWGLSRGIVRKDEYHRVLALRWRAAGALAAYLLLIPIGISNLAMFVMALLS